MLNAVDRDLTARRQEQARLETERRYRSLFQNMHEGLAYCQMLYVDGRPDDFIYLDVNAAFEAQTGLKDVVGKRVSEVIPGFRESSAELLEKYGRVAAGGPSEQFETYLAPLGMWFSISAYCPEPGQFVAVFDVVTERVQAEAALRSSNTLLAQTAAIARIGSWRMEVATGKVSWSEEMFRIFGIDNVDADFNAASAIDAAVHPDDRTIVDETRAAIVSDGIQRPAEYRIRRRDGSLRWVHAESVQEFDESGRVVALVGFVQDVTETKEAEAALRAREAELEEAQRVGRTGSWTWDARTDIPTWSEQVYRMYGIDPASAPTNVARIATLFTAESADRLRSAIARALEDGEPYELEAEFIRPDGSHGWTLHQGVPDRLPDGTLGSIHGTETDISERKRAETELRRSEVLHRTLLEQAPIAIGAHREGRGLFANEAHMKMFGYSSPEELLQLSADDMVAPESRAAANERIRRRADGQPTETEYEFVAQRRDGSTLPVLVRAATVDLPDGPATILFHVDQTENKRAIEALRASEEKFAKAFNSAPVLISLVDMEDGLWVDVNDEALRLTGFTRAEVVGHSPVEIGWMTMEDRLRIRDELESQGRISGMEMTFRARDGRPIIGLVAGEKLVVSGRECLLTATIDITERRQAEKDRSELKARLAQAQKMEAVGRLAGGIAHDFNNLLTAIGGYARIVETDLATGSANPEDAAEIRRVADRASALTAQLLAFAGRRSTAPTNVDLASAVGQILPMIRRIVPERIEIATQLRPGPMLLADPSELDQVILNLVINAADSIPAIGLISVEANAVEHDDEFVQRHPNARAGRHARLTVRDSGVGMDESVQARIFEPFFTTKSSGQGTGLGLATVYGVLERMGGTVEVVSEVGVGTTFELDFPASEPVAAQASSDGEEQVSGGSERILLVEDEQMVRDFATKALLRLGYRVVSVESPALAIEVPAADYDMLITDVVMPGMDGADLMRTLRANRPDLPVLFVSGYSHGQSGHLALERPKTALLAKPFAQAELALATRKILDEAE